MTLPDTATRKLALLTQASDDARALAFSAKQRAEQLGTRIIQLRNAQASADIERVLQQHKEALDLQQSRYESWQRIEQTVAKLKSWLAEQRDTVFEPVAAAAVETNGKTLAGLRSRITALGTEYRDVRTSALPLADAKRQARELVAMLGQRGRPHIHEPFGRLRIAGWMGDEAGSGTPTPHSVTVEFLCWAIPDVMAARLDTVLEQTPRNPDALPLDQRAVRLAEIEQLIFQLELQEEALVEQAAASGVSLERRSDQSPASILGVRIMAAAARAAA